MESIEDNHYRRHPRRPRGSYLERGKVQTSEKKVRAKTRLDFFPAPTNCPWVSEDDVFHDCLELTPYLVRNLAKFITR